MLAFVRICCSKHLRNFPKEMRFFNVVDLFRRRLLFWLLGNHPILVHMCLKIKVTSITNAQNYNCNIFTLGMHIGVVYIRYKTKPYQNRVIFNCCIVVFCLLFFMIKLGGLCINKSAFATTTKRYAKASKLMLFSVSF